jgi:hypothetical protein
LTEWTALLRRHTPQARQELKKLLAGPILFTMMASPSRTITFPEKPTDAGALVAGGWSELFRVRGQVGLNRLSLR